MRGEHITSPLFGLLNVLLKLSCGQTSILQQWMPQVHTYVSGDLADDLSQTAYEENIKKNAI